MPDLDPAALECLAALVDEGGFERAAQRLSVTQSAVSQRLRALEAQVGQRLVVRSRPLRLTEPGKVLLRLSRQWQALQADAVRELGAVAHQEDLLPVAINADSLATWVLPALDRLVQGGLALELVVDDQDFTHDWLREGRVLGCVTTVSQALRGCRVTPLGVMPYVAVARPDWVATHLPQGLHHGNWSQVPFLVFNRKDDMQRQWVARAFGVGAPRLRERFVPSSEACLRAAEMGWGIGVLPLLQVQPALDAGHLTWLRPEVVVDVALYWHQWSLGGGDATPPRANARLDAVGHALAQGAQGLAPLPGESA